MNASVPPAHSYKLGGAAPPGPATEVGAQHVAAGVVQARDHTTTPPHVEYRLTEEGLSLVPVLQAL
jgi:hypothetical protein